MYSSSFSSAGRTASYGRAMGSSAAANASRLGAANNRSSFAASTSSNSYKDKTGTTLAHAARNGVMGTTNTYKNTTTSK